MKRVKNSIHNHYIQKMSKNLNTTVYNSNLSQVIPQQNTPNRDNVVYSNANRDNVIYNNAIQDNSIPGNVSSIANNNQRKGQFQTLLFLLILLFSGITMWLVKVTSINNADLQAGIAEDIIRFHVIANSDSEQDQALKLLVKSALVENLSPFLSETNTKTEARAILASKLSYIQEVAEDTIHQKGYTYPVTVTLTDCYFPLKIYGDYTFPPGNYEALRVQIGDAKGKNWWCVMYPPLCFVDETYSIVDETSKEQLKHVLTEEEFDSLIDQKVPIKIKFKLWESLKDIFKQDKNQ